MRSKLLLIVCLLTASFDPAHVLLAQWVHPGPTGGTVTSFTSSGSDLYVSTRSGGIFSSRDSGLNWTHASAGLTDSSVARVAAFGPILLAATDSAGLFRSTDGGKHWSQSNNGLQQQLQILSFDTIGTIIFASTNVGVYRSSDGASHWVSSNAGLPSDTGIHSVKVSTLRSQGTALYLSNGIEVFRSADSGAAWVDVSKGIPGVTISDLQVGDSGLFAATPLGIYTSSNHGRDWQGPDTAGLRLRNQFFPVNQLLLQDTIVLGVTAHGLFRSMNNGQQWVAIDTSPIFDSITTFNHIGPILFAGDNNGIFRSSDGGVSWVRSNKGLYTYDTGYRIANPAAYLGSNLIAQGDSLYVSTDLGVHWSRYTALNGNRINAFVAMGRYGFVATDSNGILRTSDFGATWKVLDGMTNVYPVVSLAVGEGAVVAGTNGGGIYRSSDSGMTWVQVNSAGTWEPLSTIASNGPDFFAVLNGSGITDHIFFRSTDNGITWNAIAEPGEYVWLTQIWANNDFVFAGGSSALYRSPIDTALWESCGPRNGSDVSYAFLATDSMLFYGSGGGYDGQEPGVFLSRNDGLYWDSAGLTSHSIGDFLIAGGYLFAGTEDGLWRRALSDFPAGPPASVSSLESQPSTLLCYPNPTTRTLHIASGTNAIVITDMLGRTWLRAETGARELDVSALPRGVYSISDGRSRAEFVKE